MPLRVAKGQVVEDFIVDHSIDANAQNYLELEPWKLYFDGSSHKDGTCIGVVIISPNKIPTRFKYKVEGICSNNEAEYEVLIAGLEILLELGATRVEIMGDSELVIKKITKKYRCIKENLIMYFIIASHLLKRFEIATIRYIPRLENQVANDLAQIASGYKISKENLQKVIEVRGKVVETKLIPLDLEKTKLGYANKGNFEILAIHNLTDEDWRKLIVVYLQNPTASTDQKTRYRALSYVLFGTKLFKKSPEGILLKCLSESEAYLALSNVHNGACGEHQVGHQMKWLLFRQGMYWPTMLKYLIEFAKGCQECQGIEVIPLPNVNQEDVIEFIQKHIIYRFGIPETITTDQGSVFTGRKMHEFAKEMGFKLLTSTPYYAQANGQVEAANKVIIGLIKKHVGKKPGNLHKTLDQILWACRTSPKEATKLTPFRLTFGHDIVLLVEIHLQSMRIQRHHELPTESY
ncbi:uncharacterized protein LOC127094908 [Lathyrus oleraceus]|uniref:uncharacterized protein LOC127094908 n=1 Tax=Pisum sativum TaxID=3888 RepID=UPI0021D09C1D|nr:uncharacterized protein LOC127094908 [Pisum sativum]